MFNKLLIILVICGALAFLGCRYSDQDAASTPAHTADDMDAEEAQAEYEDWLQSEREADKEHGHNLWYGDGYNDGLEAGAAGWEYNMAESYDTPHGGDSFEWAYLRGYGDGYEEGDIEGFGPNAYIPPCSNDIPMNIV